MKRTVTRIIVVRPLKEMVSALSTRKLFIIIYDLTNPPIVIGPGHKQTDLEAVPRNYPDQTLFDGFRNTSSLYRLIRAEKPDIVHVNALQDLFSALIASRANAIQGIQTAVIGMSHNPLTWADPARSWLRAKYIQWFADGFICLSTVFKQKLIRLGVSSQKLAVIPNPYSHFQRTLQKETTARPAGKTGRQIRVLYIADICERKAQDVLIRAVPKIISRHPGVMFELVGKVVPGEEGYNEKVHSLVSELNISQCIHFTGELPYSAVIHMLKECDIFVFPSRSEMMPRAVIEALLAGKPVIASAVDGILDLVEDRSTGILVQPGNPDELSAAVCELIEKPPLAKQLSRAGQKQIMDFCSPERVGKLLQEFYEQIIAAR
jgi:glycosyltransferase involved in cell wall biosynthesis